MFIKKINQLFFFSCKIFVVCLKRLFCCWLVVLKSLDVYLLPLPVINVYSNGIIKLLQVLFNY